MTSFDDPPIMAIGTSRPHNRVGKYTVSVELGSDLAVPNPQV